MESKIEVLGIGNIILSMYYRENLTVQQIYDKLVVMYPNIPDLPKPSTIAQYVREHKPDSVTDLIDMDMAIEQLIREFDELMVTIYPDCKNKQLLMAKKKDFRHKLMDFKQAYGNTPDKQEVVRNILIKWGNLFSKGGKDGSKLLCGSCHQKFIDLLKSNDIDEYLLDDGNYIPKTDI